ncbi:MAG: autotransporter outer membrane beta-barrel domain-containing protein [Proteobacteria bacterium]|nr:autotransporter outer membrane beta-barrel domain-containing protein [Pseudomonadota bacterium]MBS0462785.1 autotransporter outer membrane beta-barrel domain-containing protein [Pseudomonadota bacterium]MBS0463459.1 autotransporter outer membrane beta-barrel domain-containing protein [Pseudomonadota bacterium]
MSPCHRNRSLTLSAAITLGGLALVAVTGSAQAQESGTAALTAQFNQVCAGAAAGSALASRCAVVLASPDPNARANAANMNDLEELPGAGRGQANDQWPARTEVETLVTPKLAVFASIDHDRSWRSNDTIEAAFDADSTTFTVGLDWHPANRWQIGATLNRQHQNQQFRGSFGRTQADATGVIAVSSFDIDDHFDINGYLGRFWGSQDVRRGVGFIDSNAIVMETASPDISRTLGGLALDANFARGPLVWRGSLGYDAATTTIDGYTESGGSGFDLIVPQRATTTRRGRLELGLADTISASWGVWQPEVRVGFIHEFANDERTVGVRFVDDTNGTVVRFDTGAPDRDWMQATFSSTFTFAHGNSGFITIGREFAHSTSTAMTLAIGWRMEL